MPTELLRPVGIAEAPKAVLVDEFGKQTHDEITGTSGYVLRRVAE